MFWTSTSLIYIHTYAYKNILIQLLDAAALFGTKTKEFKVTHKARYRVTKTQRNNSENKFVYCQKRRRSIEYINKNLVKKATEDKRRLSTSLDHILERKLKIVHNTTKINRT